MIGIVDPRTLTIGDALAAPIADTMSCMSESPMLPGLYQLLVRSTYALWRKSHSAVRTMLAVDNDGLQDDFVSNSIPRVKKGRYTHRAQC
jgi:hypothetical protein